MKGEFDIARGEPGDIEALAGASVLLTSATRQRAIVADAIAGGGCIVARDGQRLAGFATWNRWFFDKPFVLLLAVDSAYRRRGAGSLLLRALENAARPQGELFVSTETINTPMRALLAKLGYGPSGSIENLNDAGNAELVFYKRL